MNHQAEPLSDLVNNKKPALDLDALSALYKAATYDTFGMPLDHIRAEIKFVDAAYEAMPDLIARVREMESAALTMTNEKAGTEREQLRQELKASIQHCENIKKAFDLQLEVISRLAKRSVEAESKHSEALATITRVLTALIVRPYAELPYTTSEMTSREYEILQIVTDALKIHQA